MIKTNRILRLDYAKTIMRERIYALWTERRIRVVFVSSIVWGLLAHGMALFNHFHHYDDIAQLQGVGNSIVSSGRWFLSFLEYLEGWITLTPPWCTLCVPLLHGMVSILLIACISCLLVKFLDIRSIISACIVSGILCVYPTVTCSFGYLSTTPYYMFGLLLGVAGVVILSKKRLTLGFTLTGILMMVLSMSIYQAYIPFMLTVFLLALVKEILENEKIQTRDIMRQGLRFVLYSIIAFLLYLFTVKLSLLITGRVFTSYKGAIEWNVNPLDYLCRIPVAYWRFIVPDHTLFLHRRFVFILVSLFLFVSGYVCIDVLRKNRRNGLFLIALLVLFPLTMDFIYVMCPYDIIYAMMLYANTLLFVLLLRFTEYISISCPRPGKLIRFISIIACSIMLYIFVLFDNMCYLKADFSKHQAISYFTTLVSQIKGTSGYSSDMEVVYINEHAIKDPNLEDTFYWIKIPPFWSIERHYINDYVWKNYMKLWCGYSPKEGNPADFEFLPEVKAMPSYPNDGSIAIINGTIVVKLGAEPVEGEGL